MTRKRVGTSLDAAVVDVWKREVGALSNRNFAHRLAASEDLVLRLDILLKLEKHRGCVNTVSFNTDGDILVSGSDDRRIILWDWETGRVKLSFHSGHHNNVFQAKIMPYNEDRSIVTCAADGQVRHAQILERGEVETKLLGKHQGRVQKLSIEPGSPHIFYTCGEDGMVQHIDLRTGTAAELFTCEPIQSQSFMPIIHLNAIAIDPRNPNFFSVGGSDQFARLFDIRKCKMEGSTDFGQPVDFFCPPHLVDDEDVGITGLAFSEQSELLVSYSDEFIYLFSKDMGLGPDPPSTSQVFHGSDAGDMSPDNHSVASSPDIDNNRKASPEAYEGHRNCETVKGVSFFGPNSEYVVSGSDCGRIFIWKKKGGELIRVMEADKYVVNCIESHPHTTVLASSGIESDIKIWIPKAIDRATLPTNIQKDRVLNFIPRQFGFFPPSGGFYYDNNEGYHVYDNGDGDDDDYVTDDEDDDEVETDEQEEEEDGEEDDSDDFIFLGDTDEHDNEIDGSEYNCDDEEEDTSECEEIDDDFDSADSDDS
ncbi:Transducin/WD40 repeat-like superfamily protein [Abeliophyllum distichum]|uniref:Transducin/WD40 repeat-like superfamily protein n=1 Tax=Abeliophyllum distichum TaxID=126358 RepID=A0ABD1P7U5_9LAMI